MTVRSSRRRLAILALAAASLSFPGDATAQAIGLRITPRAGAVTPADWFYEEFRHFGAEPLEWTEAALLRAPIAGLTLELAGFRNSLWVRAEVLRTFGQEASVVHAVVVPPSEAGPAVVVRTPYRVDAAMTVATLDLALPTRLRLPLGLQPYVTAGVGGKRYDFDVASIEPYEDRIVLPQEGTTLVFNLGAGATARVLGLDLDLLVRDALSEYWGKQQHDVTLLLGVSVPLVRAHRQQELLIGK